MKTIVRVLSLCVFCSLAAPLTPSQQQRNRQRPVSPEGIYSSLEYSGASGDVGGMEVTIISAFNPEGNVQYYAVVQTAAGVPLAPVLVRARIRGSGVEFTIPAVDGAQAVRYSGTITAAGLRLRDNTGDSRTLRRKNCR